MTKLINISIERFLYHSYQMLQFHENFIIVNIFVVIIKYRYRIPRVLRRPVCCLTGLPEDTLGSACSQVTALEPNGDLTCLRLSSQTVSATMYVAWNYSATGENSQRMIWNHRDDVSIVPGRGRRAYVAGRFPTAPWNIYDQIYIYNLIILLLNKKFWRGWCYFYHIGLIFIIKIFIFTFFNPLLYLFRCIKFL